MLWILIFSIDSLFLHTCMQSSHNNVSFFCNFYYNYYFFISITIPSIKDSIIIVLIIIWIIIVIFDFNYCYHLIVDIIFIFIFISYLKCFLYYLYILGICFYPNIFLNLSFSCTPVLPGNLSVIDFQSFVGDGSWLSSSSIYPLSLHISLNRSSFS